MKKPIIIFVGLNAIASLLNYLTYPLLAHVLPSKEFVNITVALSLFTQVSTFLASIVAITIGLSKHSDRQSAAKKVEQLQTILMQIFIVLVVLFVALSPYLLSRVKLPTILVIPVSLLMLISVPTADNIYIRI